MTRVLSAAARILRPCGPLSVLGAGSARASVAVWMLGAPSAGPRRPAPRGHVDGGFRDPLL